MLLCCSTPACEEELDSVIPYPHHSLQESRANGHDSLYLLLLSGKGDIHSAHQAGGQEVR